jgi:hypothetical protein
VGAITVGLHVSVIINVARYSECPLSVRDCPVRHIGAHPGDEPSVTFLRRFQGCAEPAGAPLAARALRWSAGSYACGPGDVCVWADQEGVGWSVIGFGSVELSLSPMIPVGYKKPRARRATISGAFSSGAKWSRPSMMSTVASGTVCWSLSSGRVVMIAALRLPPSSRSCAVIAP